MQVHGQLFAHCGADWQGHLCRCEQPPARSRAATASLSGSIHMSESTACGTCDDFGCFLL